MTTDPFNTADTYFDEMPHHLADHCEHAGVRKACRSCRQKFDASAQWARDHLAVEVRKAKAEALREPALAILMDSFDASVADHLADAGYTEYAEDEDGGLTWVSAPLSEVLLIVRTCATEYETGHQA